MKSHFLECENAKKKEGKNQNRHTVYLGTHAVGIPVYATMFGEKFQIYGVTGKCIPKSKYWI